MTAVDAERVVETVAGRSVAIEAIWDDGALAGIVVAGSPAVHVPVDALDPLNAAESIAGHDIKAFVRALIEMGREPPPVSCDTALAAWIANPTQRVPDLADLAYRDLGLSVEGAADSDAVSQGSFDFEGGVDLEAVARRAVAVEGLIKPLTEQLEGTRRDRPLPGRGASSDSDPGADGGGRRRRGRAVPQRSGRPAA